MAGRYGIFFTQSLLALAILSLLTVVACSSADPPETAEDLARFDLKWVRAPGNSFAAYGVVDQVHGPETIRCWKRKDIFQCFQAWTLPTGGAIPSMDYFNRFTLKNLPKQLPEQHYEGGYHCNFVTDMSIEDESISRNKNTLISNLVSRFNQNRPWSRAFVERYERQNGIRNGEPYYNCAAAMAVLEHGSLASFGSSSFTYNMIR